MKARWLKLTFALLLVIASGCGKPPQTVIPAPPPAPTNGGGYTGGFSGSCGSVGGIGNLNPNGTPYYADLYLSQQYGQQNYGFGGNSLVLNIQWATQAPAEQLNRPIVASGNFNFADLMFMSQKQFQTTNFCVSSSSPGFTGSTPGVFVVGQNQLSLTLRGLIQVPLYSPYGGGYGTQTPVYGQEIITLRIGGVCPAYLFSGRIFGCVEVAIGQSQAMIYQAQ